EQHRVIALSKAVVAPKYSVRKDLEKSGDDAFRRVRIALVKRNPQAHYPTRLQVRLAHFIVLDGVERSAALDPRIDRVRSDDVEFLFRGADEMPAVIQDDL